MLRLRRRPCMGQSYSVRDRRSRRSRVGTAQCPPANRLHRHAQAVHVHVRDRRRSRDTDLLASSANSLGEPLGLLARIPHLQDSDRAVVGDGRDVELSAGRGTVTYPEQLGDLVVLRRDRPGLDDATDSHIASLCRVGADCTGRTNARGGCARQTCAGERRPLALSSDIAVSACPTSSVTVSPSSGQTPPPTLAPTEIATSPTVNGSRKADRTRASAARTWSTSRTSARMIANSSPPRRAIPSPLRAVASRRCAAF